MSDPINFIDPSGKIAIQIGNAVISAGAAAIAAITGICLLKDKTPKKKKENCQKVFESVFDSCIAGRNPVGQCSKRAGEAYRACVQRANGG